MKHARMLKMLDATLGSALCRLIGGLGLFGIRRMPPTDVRPTPGVPLRILVIRPGGMGDLILLLPALGALQRRHPDAAITVVCEARNADVFALTDLHVTPVLYDRAPLRAYRALRYGHFDMAIDTEQFHHFSAILALLTGAPVRIGFNINPRRNPLYTHLVPYAVDGHEARQFLRLFAPLAIQAADIPMTGALPHTSSVPPDMLPWSGPGTEGPLIVIHPSTGSRYKDWGVAPFAGLVDELVRRHHARCVILGSARDASLCRGLVDAVPAPHRDQVRSLAGTLDLTGTAAVINAANLFIGLDSGLAHIAAACGIPAVVLYGATDPAKWAAPPSHCRVVRRQVPCAPCAIFGYHKPCATFACIRGISTDDVLHAVDAILA